MAGIWWQVVLLLSEKYLPCFPNSYLTIYLLLSMRHLSLSLRVLRRRNENSQANNFFHAADVFPLFFQYAFLQHQCTWEYQSSCFLIPLLHFSPALVRGSPVRKSTQVHYREWDNKNFRYSYVIF